MHGHSCVVELLLASGANPDVQTEVRVVAAVNKLCQCASDAEFLCVPVVNEQELVPQETILARHTQEMHLYRFNLCIILRE